MNPAVIATPQQTRLSLYDVGFAFGIEAGQTDGRLSVIEVTIPPATLVKPHRHAHEDEFTFVLSGTVGARIGDETVETIPAGSCLVKPRDLAHAMWNVGAEPVRILEIVSPGGLEAYFRELAPILGQKGPEWTARYGELAERFGLEILDDWTDELEQRYGISL